MAGLEEVFNVIRHEHRLYFMDKLQAYKCSGCKGRGANIGFTCRSCPDFLLHLPCAALPDKHKHPFFSQDPFKFRPKTRLRHDCDACGFLLRGFVFQSDKGLRLHPLCMDLPTVFTHSGHPQQVLELVIPKEGKYSCTRCKKENTKWKYWCRMLNCEVNLDMNCAIMEFLGLAKHGITQVYKPSRTKHALEKIGNVANAVGSALLPVGLGVATNGLTIRGHDDRGVDHGGGCSEEEAGRYEPTGR